MSTVEEIIKERNEVRSDLLALKKPKRLFMTVSFSMEAACQYSGIDPKEAHYNLELYEKAYDKMCADVISDTQPSNNLRFPATYQILGAKHWVVGSKGTMQHPEIEVMRDDEYDEFIKAPYKTIVEKFLPRVCAALTKDPAHNALKLATAYGTYKNFTNGQAAIGAKMRAKYGFVGGVANHQMVAAPFDFLSDQLRGFKGITIDARRFPDKVKAAMEVILPLQLKLAKPAVPRPGLVASCPLHLAPYLNKKQFEELWWPTFERMVLGLQDMGIGSSLFVEDDWTRFTPWLEKLPNSTIMYMEYGDPKVFTETIGKNHVFGGFYNPTITLMRSKEECIDEAKRLFDTCMKSDHFFFRFDRSVMDIKSVDMPKLLAVLEWVRNVKY